MYQKFIALKNELLSFSPKEKLFIFGAMLCGFLIASEYAIIRPVCNSLFIFSYGSDLFPYAWLATVPLNLGVVHLYNRYLPKFGCYKMFLIISSIIVGGNVFCAFFLQKLSFLPFIFYIWKEVYILLMLQQLWSVIHSTIAQNKAKYIYGILFAVGGFGGIVGSAAPGFFAVKMGSENLLFLTLPIYFLLFFFYRILLKTGSVTLPKESHSQLSVKESVQLISKSRFLLFILLIVILMQTCCALLDFQFNSVLENTILDKDLRTQYMGRVMGVIQMATVTLQILGSFLIVQLLGLRKSHFFVPLLLGVNALGFLFFPVFGMISFGFATIKAMDFSIFNVIKEMLYIPMKVDEKFQAKAIIDVFAYRTSKAFASLLILFLQFFSPAKILPLISGGTLLLFILWVAIVARLFRKEDALVKS